MTKSCSVAGCTDAYYAIGLCGKHYTRQKKGQSLTEKSRYQLSDKERFEAKFVTHESGCWNWKFPKPGGRANTFNLFGKTQNAHKAAYRIYKGEVPDGLCILHTCDNGLCVNPEHLFLGTHKENTEDMYKKGRNVTLRGEQKTKTSKLNNAAVFDIRSSTLNGNQLAKKYGVTRSVIYDVLEKRSWKHLL